ncbi:MAG TPA: hypothetical protein VLG69_01420 [Candidatus Andersenbacteria bacterium]|nr:hypothetical protein [Candidatus Andersenbacteria bacterium]
MKKKIGRTKNKDSGPTLRDDELSNSGVGKILLEENKKLALEVDALKKSLKVNQNELEKLRGKNHELDKQNSILDYRLNIAFLPEFLKFIASSFGAGLAVSFFFSNQIRLATITLAASMIVYGVILFFYKK